MKFYIEMVGYGLLTNQGETDPIEFSSIQEARAYLKACDELQNLGTEWMIRSELEVTEVAR